MSKLTVTVNGIDYTQYLTEYSRVVDICNILCQTTLRFIPKTPMFDPYNEVTVDYLGVRRFTGYVSATNMQRSSGKWEYEVVADHRGIKRMNDYYFDYDVQTRTGYYVGEPVEYCKDFITRVAGGSGILTHYNTDYNPIVPYYTWVRPRCMDVVMDCLLFAGIQLQPSEDGSVNFISASASGSVLQESYSSIVTDCTRWNDDSYFRTDVIVYGGDGETQHLSGSSPYGLTRTAVVANPMARSIYIVGDIAQKLISEFNRLLEVQRATISGFRNLNVGDTVNFRQEDFSRNVIVTNIEESANRQSGYAMDITTNQHCAKIFGYEQESKTQITIDYVGICNGTSLGLSKNFFTSGSAVHWVDITPTDIKDSEKRDILQNFVISPYTSECWLAVHDNIDGEFSGIWYTPTVEDPSWNCILTSGSAQQQAHDTSPPAWWSSWDNHFDSLCLVGREMYTTLSGNVMDTGLGSRWFHWWHGTYYLTHEVAYSDGNLYTVAGQWATSCNNGQARFGGGAVYGTGGQSFDCLERMVRWNYSNWGYNQIPPYSFDNAPVCSDTLAITNQGCQSVTPYYEYNPLTVAPDTNYPLVEEGTHYFWTRLSDSALMLDASTIQAVPNDMYGAKGVFSSGSLGRVSIPGSYCCVYGYGQIIWTAKSESLYNDVRNIAYTENGGVDWQTKDGDWVEEIGPWGGPSPSILLNTVVRFCPYTVILEDL